MCRIEKRKSNGLTFTVQPGFTATVKVAIKLKKSVESRVFELDFKNFAQVCKLNKTPHILTVADKSANKKTRPRWSGFVPCKFR